MGSTRLSLALGGLLVVIAVPAVINPYGFVGLGDRRLLLSLLAVAGFVLLGVAGVRLAISGRGARRWLSAFGAGCAALAVLASLAFSLLLLATSAPGLADERRVAATSPDGRFEVLLHYAYRPSAKTIGRPTGLYLQTTDGFFGRRDFLGCPSGSDRLSVRFTAGNAIVVGEAGPGGEDSSVLRFDPARVRALDGMGDSCSRYLYTS